jgi:hypothetical protein
MMNVICMGNSQNTLAENLMNRIQLCFFGEDVWPQSMNLCPSGSYFTLPVNRRTLPIFPRRMMLARPVGGRAKGEGTASPSRHLARPRLDAKNTIEPIRPLDTGDVLAAECFDMWHVF